jgi:hypothetical protein
MQPNGVLLRSHPADHGDQDEVLGYLESANIQNTVVLTGDFHAHWWAALRHALKCLGTYISLSARQHCMCMQCIARHTNAGGMAWDGRPVCRRLHDLNQLPLLCGCRAFELPRYPCKAEPQYSGYNETGVS